MPPTSCEATLLERLSGLESELHRLETRKSRGRMESLLHADFVEISRSGQCDSTPATA